MKKETAVTDEYDLMSYFNPVEKNINAHFINQFNETRECLLHMKDCFEPQSTDDVYLKMYLRHCYIDMTGNIHLNRYGCRTVIGKVKPIKMVIYKNRILRPRPMIKSIRKIRKRK